MFQIIVPDTQIGPTPEPPDVVSAVVAKVRVPSALRLATNGWTRLRSEYEQAQQRLQAFIRDDLTSVDPVGRVGRQKTIQAAQDELTQINEQIKPALAAIREARVPFVAAVRSALSPMQARAASRAIDALAVLDTEFALLDAVADELQRWTLLHGSASGRSDLMP